MKKEEFRGIEGFENYQISNLGTVKRLKGYRVPNERILNPYINKSGYCIVSLMNNRKESKKRVHILVAEAFLGHSTIILSI